MKITLLGQGLKPTSEHSVGNQLIKFFADPEFDTFTGISAFASLAGVNGISNYLKKARHLNKITIVVGIDLKGTSEEALLAILALKVSSYIFYTPPPAHVTFHPKIYLFEGKMKSELIIGSSNITGPGLFSNVETSLLISIDNNITTDYKIIEQLKEYYKSFFSKTDPNLKIISKKLITDLVKARIVPTEAERKVTQEKSSRVDREATKNIISKIFPKRAFAKLPKEFRSKTKIKEIQVSGLQQLTPIINNYTEPGFHFPQGLHLGHIFFILKSLLNGHLENTHLDKKYIKLHGNFNLGRLGRFQRQTKFKLIGLMELGLIIDDRKITQGLEYNLQLTKKGKQFTNEIKPLLESLDLSFKSKSTSFPSWEMTLHPSVFNEYLKKLIQKNKKKREIITGIFLEMQAVTLMFYYLHGIGRKKKIRKKSIYKGFFKASFVIEYCKKVGIKPPTETGAEHRCPFLLNILESLDIIKQNTREIDVI